MLSAAGTALLVLLDGPTGAGKSTLLRLLRENEPAIHVGRKRTTRPRRNFDNDWEFEFVDELSEDQREYSFGSLEHEYAVDGPELRRALREGRSYAITCSHPALIERLRRNHPALVLYVYRPIAREELEGLLRIRGTADAADAAHRRAEVENAIADYTRNIQLYDHVILNVADEMSMLTQARAVLRR